MRDEPYITAEAPVSSGDPHKHRSTALSTSLGEAPASEHPSEQPSIAQPRSPRILIFSQRNIFKNALFRSAHYEFENIISQIDSVELFAPQLDPSGRRHAIAKRIAFHAPIALNPGLQRIPPKAHYDLFLAICGAPGDLLMVNAVRNWREVCKISICLIDELWVRQMADHRHFLRVLEKFDVVMLYYSQSVNALSERIRRKCVFLPPGVDTILFSPYPAPPKRVVDVCSIGRRSETTHQALLKMVSEDGIFYLYDSIAGDQAIHSSQHRALFANVAKRSRYFIVNPGLIDRPDKRGDQIEIGNRYFEGTAAGAILVGERPNNQEFDRLFDWPDAVIPLLYNSPDISLLVKELDRQPERQERIRRTNVVQALLRHDWVYRWETMLKTAGLEPMPELLQRKERLRAIAAAVSQNDTMPSGDPSEPPYRSGRNRALENSLPSPRMQRTKSGRSD
jgi:glycosyl transferase family 1